MLCWQWRDGCFSECDAIPISDRGFRYGMSLFESFPVVAGIALFIDEHIRRLEQGCREARFILPPDALAYAGALLRESGSSGFARIYVTAGDGSLTDAFHGCRVYLFIEERQPVSQERLAAGFRLGLDQRRHIPLSGWKTGNYWGNALALSQCRERGQDEAVLMDAAGRLISTASANLFLVKAGEVLTPAPSTGARMGVIRAWVMSKTPVLECDLAERDLHSAQEVFITNSWLGIMPVVAFRAAAFRSTAVSTRLRQEYASHVEHLIECGKSNVSA